MKKTNTIKILVLAISLALLLCGIIGVTASAQNDDASAPATASSDVALEVYMKNVSFQNSPQLVFAVAYENCDSSSITLDVWYGEKSGEAQSVTSFGNVTIGGKVYPAFAVNPINPKDLDTVVYAQAKSGDVTSEVERYSILEYAWSGVMTAKTDAEAADYYNIIDYSASVQKFLANKFDGTPVGNYFYVKAEGVALDDNGYDSGIFTAPITFTLGESAKGWNVTTYANGVRTTEVKESGAEITVSASTICTPVEARAPQSVSGTPVDWENTSVNNGVGGEGTTNAVGNQLVTTKKGVTETTGKDGNTTKAYYYDSDSGSYDMLRFQSNGDDLDKTMLSGANALVFDSDVKIDFTEGATSDFRVAVGCYGITSRYAHALLLRRDKTTGFIKLLDQSSVTGTGDWVTTDVKSGEWFNLRIEYYKVSADEVLALIYVNGELVYASNRALVANSKGDDAWPVFAEGFVENGGTTFDGTSAVYFDALANTDATVYFDNTLLRRTTLTVPTLSVDEYTSYAAVN